MVEEIILFTSPLTRGSFGPQDGQRLTGIENVRGSRFNDRIYGNELINKLLAMPATTGSLATTAATRSLVGLGNDILRGGNARDYLFATRAATNCSAGR